MPVNSKQKGKAFERAVANMFKEYGYDAHRTAQFRGNTGQAADVEGVPYLSLECKHQERMYLYDWMEQAERDAAAQGKGNTPVVVHKQNRKEVLVSMRFADFVEMYKAWAKEKDSGAND